MEDINIAMSCEEGADGFAVEGQLPSRRRWPWCRGSLLMNS